MSVLYLFLLILTTLPHIVKMLFAESPQMKNTYSSQI